MAMIIYLKDVLKKALTQSSHMVQSGNEAKSNKSGNATKTRITRKASTLCSSLIKKKTKQQQKE